MEVDDPRLLTISAAVKLGVVDCTGSMDTCVVAVEVADTVDVVVDEVVVGGIVGVTLSDVADTVDIVIVLNNVETDSSTIVVVP